MKNEQFEQNLRKKLSTFEKEPSAQMWAKIEAELNNKPQRRTIVWKRYAAVAAMLLLLLGSTFFMVNHDDNAFSNDSPTLSVQSEPTAPAVTSPIQAHSTAAAVSQSPSVRSAKLAQRRSTLAEAVPVETIVKPSTTEPPHEALPTVADPEPEKSSVSEPINAGHAVPVDPDKRQEAIDKFLSDGEQARLAAQRRQQNESPLLSIGMVAKGTPASTSSGLTNGGNTFSNRAVANFPDERANNPVPGKTFHLIPISVGVTVQKGLGKGFSLETGLMYTYLYSTFEKAKDPVVSKDQQSLHYLGIPLALKYEFLSFDKFYLFAKLGAMLEGNIYGEIHQSIIYPYTTFSHTEKVRDEKLQTSLFLAPGIGYEITRNIHLGLEPSVQYYIPNGSNLQTIRTDQPFAFNLRLGISYNF